MTQPECESDLSGLLTIEIPNPSLVLLIGSSGAGKSTFAARHFSPTEVVSSDHCRAMICDDESDQRINAQAFGLLHHIARLRLQDQRLTVIDATNLQFRARRPLLRMARANHLPVIAIVFNVSADTCLSHNRVRPQRIVGEEVLQQHQQQLTTTLARLQQEGYHHIHLLDETGIGTAQVRKTRQEVAG
jgi:protein phosphatase